MKEMCGSGVKWEEMYGREVVGRKRKQKRKVYYIAETYNAQYI
jgi:hypothetical protein